MMTIDAFAKHTDKNSGGSCWVWTGAKFVSGYGMMVVNYKYLRAHRWAYEYFVGPIPNGLELDHLCRNKLCVNPDHLEAVTHKVNMERSVHPMGPRPKPVSSCKRGHEFNAENTDYRPTSTGGVSRNCRICQKIHKASPEAKAAKNAARREKTRLKRLVAQ